MADSTINGLTALVGSDVDQTADQFALWDNSAATTKKITRTNVMNGPLVGDVGSAVRAAADSYGGVAFDGATSGTRVTSTLTGQNIGTGDFSIWVRIKVPTSGGGYVLTAVNNQSASAFAIGNAFLITIESNGALGVYGYVGSTFTTAFTVSGFRDTYSGQVVDIALTRSTVSGTSTLTAFVNGLSVGSTSAAIAAESVNSTYFHVGGLASKQPNHSCYRAVLFNRALSASDVAELSISGVNPADQFGTQAQVIGYSPAVNNGGFETNLLNAAGTWGNTGALGSSTATIDTSGSFSHTGSNAGKFTLDGSGSFCGFQAAIATNIAVIGKRYRISFWARKGASSGSSGIQFGHALNGSAYGSTGLSLATTYAQTIVELVATAGTLTIGRQAGSAANAEIYIDDVVFERIGAIVDLDLGSGIGYQAHDRSTNLLHGTLYGGTSWTNPEKSGTVYGTTSTNGNQQLLASASIPADATITSIVVNSNGGTPNITIGNASGGTQLLGSTALTGVSRQILTPTLPISTTGNLWINSTSTATLNWTINYTTSF